MYNGNNAVYLEYCYNILHTGGNDHTPDSSYKFLVVWYNLGSSPFEFQMVYYYILNNA